MLVWDAFRHLLPPDDPDLDLQGEYSICYIADRPTPIKEILSYNWNGVLVEDIFGRVTRVALASLLVC